MRSTSSSRPAVVKSLAACLCAAMALAAAPVTAPAGGARTTLQDAVWKGPDGEPLPFQSDEQILEFLRTADFESIEDIELGVTNPRQVVLQKDAVRIRAALRDYDETYTETRIDGEFYPRLRDAFIFDVPAYKLSKLLGLNNIPPVTFRRYGGQQVTLQAWLEGGLMERDRIEQGLDPPSIGRFRQQSQDMRVFDSVIGNVDRNSGNILVDEQGNFWLIDHSRAFMRNDETRYLERVTMCSRQLFEGIKALNREQLLPLLSPPLTESEVDWTLRRRDKVVAHIAELIETRGEGAVLFDPPR